MDVREFQEKLKEIQETARSQGGSLKAEQIRETFGNAGLDSSQQAGVLRYLTSQGISIEGADAGKDKEQQEERQAVPLTEEEKAEQAALRREYIESIRNSLRGHLNSISIVEKDGTITDLGKKYGHIGDKEH